MFIRITIQSESYPNPIGFEENNPIRARRKSYPIPIFTIRVRVREGPELDFIKNPTLQLRIQL